ncbi:MAG: hypothetical protein HC889_12470 [Synechococcaceae cyanobacterium SM1_2_3]|nr:hypothetical protein [Synechococcaceae cyanobacterium SM1_2_3]
MKQWTGIEIKRARLELEDASSTILGCMIFEFSRLDCALGLMLVWANDGADLEGLSKAVAGHTFHKKLLLLSEFALTKYKANQETMSAYADWLAEAHAVRGERNCLIHGRWGTDPMRNQVVNVVGLPTGEQVERRYTITQLKEVLVRMQRLQEQLSTLRTRWPV